VKEFGVVRVFLAIQRNFKIVNKRYKRKQSKQKKTKSVLHAGKHRICTQKMRKSKYTQKIKQSDGRKMGY